MGKTEDDMFRSLAGGGDVPGEEAIKAVLRRPPGDMAILFLYSLFLLFRFVLLLLLWTDPFRYFHLTLKRRHLPSPLFDRNGAGPDRY